LIPIPDKLTQHPINLLKTKKILKKWDATEVVPIKGLKTKTPNFSESGGFVL